MKPRETHQQVTDLASLSLHSRIMLSCLLLVSTGGAGAAAPEAASDRLTGEAGRQRVECLTKALTIAGRQVGRGFASAGWAQRCGLEPVAIL